MKNVLFFMLCFCNFHLLAQKTIVLTPVADDGISFHDFAASANQNYGHSLWNIAHSQVAGIGQGINTGRTLILFDFAVLPKNAVITKAQLDLYAYPTPAGPTYHGHNKDSGTNASLLKAITSPWISQQVTWNTRPSSTSDDEVFLHESTQPFEDYLNIDVTTLVKKMFVDQTKNFGFEFRVINESPTRALIFCSTDYAEKSRHPRLTVYYEDANPTGNNGNGNTGTTGVAGNCESDANVFIPNSFSPNDDGTDDYFTVFSNVNLTVDYLRIFDRWGSLVYEQNTFSSNNENLGWNGMNKGQNAATGTYVCDIKVTDKKGCSKSYHTDLNLLR